VAEYFKIGKLVAAFGVNGQLILQHELGKKTSLKGLQAIFIEEKKNLSFHGLSNLSKLKVRTKYI